MALKNKWYPVKNNKTTVSFTKETSNYHDNVTLKKDEERKMWVAFYGHVGKKPSVKMFKRKADALAFAKRYMK